MSRDFQKSAVYNWEDSFHEGGIVNFEQAKVLVGYIWADMGYDSPPKVEAISPNSSFSGEANRLVIRFRPTVTLKTVLHELAHSMTSELDYSDKHGPDFVGVYVKLLHKYMNVDLFEMIKTLAVSGVKMNYTAKPYFLD